MFFSASSFFPPYTSALCLAALSFLQSLQCFNGGGGILGETFNFVFQPVYVGEVLACKALQDLNGLLPPVTPCRKAADI